MTREEAIVQMQRAAESKGFGWSDTVFANRYRVWPWQAFWRISARFGGEDGFHVGYVIAIVHEETQRVSLHLVRPWSDFSMGRVVAVGVAVAIMASLVAGLSLGLLKFSPTLYRTLRPIILTTAFILPMFFAPVARMLGKDTWLLRRDAPNPRPEQ